MENNPSLSAYDSEPQASELQTLRATVRGRVQNVGFRMFVLEVGRSLDVVGYVRYEYDGSVAVMAAGTRTTLELLLAALRRGPAHARVDRVDVDWHPGNPHRLAGAFEVRA